MLKTNETQYQEIMEEFFNDPLTWQDENVAFIKEDEHQGRKMWLIYAADGTKIAATENRDFAFVMARQNNLVPQSAH